MNRENALRIAAALPPTSRVLDVGGGYAPFPAATHVLDGIAYHERNGATAKLLEDAIPPRYTRESWCQRDACDHTPWPWPDKYFDFVTCSHLLEDVRDPIWVCSELQRVARAGYIEVPSRILEQCLGVENPTYAGFYHHRWLVEAIGDEVVFVHKPHSLHTLRDAIVAKLGANERLSPRYDFTSLEWAGSFKYGEKLSLSEAETDREMISFAAIARQLPGLVESRGGSVKERLGRRLYFARLRRGSR